VNHGHGQGQGQGTARTVKFRQAAFAYLVVGILYESAVLAVWKNGLLPATRGPVALWLVLGAAIVALVVWSLIRYQRPWIARTVFVLHALRLPSLISGAFFPSPDRAIAPSFYGAALIVVIINLWMLARAGWDL
jgi:glucan phosphoethanolaminetransferase (alkaline phosphatase superfamily)